MEEQELPITRPGLIYLNHAAVSPWPLRTVRAVTDFARENHAAGAEAYPKWMLKEQQLRRQLKQLINAPSIEDVALVKNTSEAISFVAAGLDWHPGDRIITAKGEFPSNWIPWDALRARGVEVVAVDILNAEDPETALFAAVDDRTRVLAISSVQFASGFRLHLQRIGRALKPTKTLFLVDAIQSLGVFPIDVQEDAIDLLMADGHKWLLAPEGLGIFYVSAAAREMIEPTQFGWHMVEHPGHFDSSQWQPARSARRYECGSPNMLGIHALSASLSFLLEIGIDQIKETVLSHQAVLNRTIQASPKLELLSSSDPQRASGIVLFRHREHAIEMVFRSLKRRGVVCALRGGGIRFSPHFYTKEAQLLSAVEWASISPLSDSNDAG